MQHFATLFARLDQTNKTNAKVDALATFFDQAQDEDKLWAIALFSGKRPRRAVNTTLLRTWAAELSGLPQWLFEESYHVVGDLAETIALLLPPPEAGSDKTLKDWMAYLEATRDLEEEEKKQRILAAWSQLTAQERFVFNKLLTGGFRMGASQKLMVRALARHTGLEANAIAHRLMGEWLPQTANFQELLFSENTLDDLSRPYPFYLAYQLEDPVDSLGTPDDWQVEWKWDGIRGQLICRQGNIFLWSRGEELITEKFPEFESLVENLPEGTVIDGEIVVMKEGIPQSFNLLQTRIGRKKLSKKILMDAPAHMIAYDLLEWEGKDMRDKPLATRRGLLEGLITGMTNVPMSISETIAFDDWVPLAELREHARSYHAEGFMLKKLAAPYQVGRKRGDWWKWKVDPLTIDAVMIYAQRGHGRRANLFSDYTFAVWKEDALVPFTKAYSGLTDAEMREVDRFVKQNTLERFGPVRSVTPQLVFEIGFEGINKSPRHKSGVALRFPRILRWRTDKPPEQADTLAHLHQMLEQYG
ncbi:MAG: ATP-dependent DNA ligase [Bacteroidota bacterium]